MATCNDLAPAYITHKKLLEKQILDEAGRSLVGPGEITYVAAAGEAVVPAEQGSHAPPPSERPSRGRGVPAGAGSDASR